MPSTKSNKNLRRLPANPEPEGVRCICVQVPDDEEWVGAFYGQIQRLALQSIWDRDEEHTAQVVARRWLEVYLQTLEGNCSDVPCILPPPFDIDIGVEIRIVRQDDDGHWQELCGDSWCTPSGDYTVPEPEEREESTSAERKCLAAANAVHLLDLTYEAATDAFTSDSTQVAVYEAIIGVVASGLGVWAVGFTASGLVLAAGLFFAWYELLETVTADLWTTDFTEELVCILYNTAIDTAGVITFDYPAFLTGIYDLIYSSGLDLEKQLLLQQVLFMLSFIGADGINVAGGTTEVEDYDCDPCTPWQHTFNFVSNEQGFSNIIVSNADHSNYCTTGTSNNINNADGWKIRISPYKHIGLTFTLSRITKFSITYNNQNGAVDFYLFNKDDAYDYWSSNEVASRHSSATGAQTYTSGDIDVMANQVAMARCGINDNFCNWTSLTLWGIGDNPFD